MTTLLLDCTHGSTKDGFANAVRALAPESLPPIESYVSKDEESEHRGCANVSLRTPNPEHAHAHHHHSLAEVHAAIEAAPVAEAVKEDARGVYALIAAAEAKAHGVSEAEVHFHEVGAPEAIAHILAACDAMTRIPRTRTVATPICTGFGYVDCAHGRLPIPAPATANVLEGYPTFAGSQEGELTTPTGAALAVYFADEFVEAIVDADIVICCNPC